MVQARCSVLGYESREVSKDACELTIRMPDGSELVEQFSDPTALHNRQVILEREWADGWTGPHGRNL